MNVYGTLDLQNNLLANVALNVETSFPSNPKSGRLVFKENVLYICVLVAGNPSWIPLTNELATLVFTDTVGSDTWEINHNYGTNNLVIQIYDETNTQIFPDTIEQPNNNKIIVKFSQVQTGKAIVIAQHVNVVI